MTAARITFHRIAYEALTVCNALEMAAIERMVALTPPAWGARMLDIGAGNAAVAIRLTQAFGLDATAVELDPGMAELARARIAASRAAVALVEGAAGPLLAETPPWDLIVAIGATDPAGQGRLEPRDLFGALSERLAPGGALIWGDLFWIGEPPAPLRQIVELNNRYATHAGWQAAARDAGLIVEAAEISGEAAWAAYAPVMDQAARDWLQAHPDHPDADGVRLSADRVKAMFEFGRPWLGFGLYRLRRAA